MVQQAMPYSFIVAFFFACLSDAVFRWRQFRLDPSGVGMTFYGGLSGFVLFWWTFARAHRMEFLPLLEVFLPPIAVAQAFGRVGCFLGGCCHGRPLAPWCGIVPTAGSPAFSMYGDIPVFPVQLVEAVWLLCVGGVLLLTVRFGCRAAWYLILVGAGRFLFEFFRGDMRGAVFSGCPLSPAQCLSVAAVVCGTCLLVLRRRHLHGIMSSPAENWRRT